MAGNRHFSKQPMARYYHTENATVWIEAMGAQIAFQPYENFGGSWRGIYATESDVEISALNELASNPRTSVKEITEQEYSSKRSRGVTQAPQKPRVQPRTSPQVIRWEHERAILVSKGYSMAAVADILKAQPPIRAQTPWKAGQLNLPITNDLVYYNAALVRSQKRFFSKPKLWCIARRWMRQGWIRQTIWISRLEALELDENMEIVGRMDLQMPATDKYEQFEDPRAVIGPDGRVYVSYCTWISGKRYVAHQAVAVFDDTWNSSQVWHPPYGNNADRAGVGNGHEKNWSFFLHYDRWHMLYSFQPHTVVEMTENLTPVRSHKTLMQQIPWGYGEIRGGTPPVRISADRYLTFFHSSMPWRGNQKRYFMGAYQFQAEPPFAPMEITRMPLLAGSEHDTRVLGSPLVVFPCGSVLGENYEWTVTLGVNDEAVGWIKIPHSELMTRLTPIL